MYVRLNTQDTQILHKQYSNDRLYQNMHNAISELCKYNNDITPEEIWQIAGQYVSQIVQTENDVFEIDALPEKLYFLLSEYKQENNIIKRSKAEIECTVFLVELVILYQLARFQKEWNDHPYKNHCLAILKQIESNPLLEKIIPLIKHTNDRYEPNYGCEIEPFDYLPFVIKKDSLIKEAAQLSNTCKEFLTRGYDTTWLAKFWTYMAQSSEGDNFLRDLQGANRYTTIYRIIGVLKQRGVFRGSQTDLAELSPLKKPNKESIRKYISDGENDSSSTYAKIVIQYVEDNKPKINY